MRQEQEDAEARRKIWNMEEDRVNRKKMWQRERRWRRKEKYVEHGERK